MPAIGSVADTMLNDADQVTFNAAVKTNYEKGLRKVTEATATDTATLTAADILEGIVRGTPVSAATYTLPTAALLVAAISDAAVGDSFEFVVLNEGADTDAITLEAGAGGTDYGTLTVAQNVARKFMVYLTNVTASSEAYVLVGLG